MVFLKRYHQMLSLISRKIFEKKIDTLGNFSILLVCLAVMRRNSVTKHTDIDQINCNLRKGPG